ncbi:SUMF1/EgtB/PvdO family nonheme iron enzyme [Calothrix sp. FACHB-156]|nr:SUMF1/EgtB/PvdO family nonheme iron enzyme [Calothrix sp. FACHB-156]
MAKVALLIGISEYEPGLNPLPAAVNDIEAVRRVLVNPEMGNFAAENITVLANPERQKMEEAIEKLFVDRQKDDLVVFFFSGHGIKDDTGKLYLATRTTRKTAKGDLIRASAVTASFVHESISRSRSQRQVIILDCCFSGAIAQGMTVKDDGNVNVQEQLGGKGRAILTSSTSTQYSFEQEGSELSIYTRYLVEGIETGAADKDTDGYISIDELHEYASTKVQEASPAMTPKFYPVEEGHKILLAKSPKDDPKLKYRKEFDKIALEDEGNISRLNRISLNVLRDKLGLSTDEVNEIELEVLEPYRERQKKLKIYTEALSQITQYPLSDKDRYSLKRLQNFLNFRDEDIEAIEQRVLAPKKAEYEQQQAEKLRQERERVEIQRKQQEAERLHQEQQKAELQKQGEIKSSPAVSVPKSTPVIQTQTFEFDTATLTVNTSGWFGMGKKNYEIKRSRGRAEFFTENLGNGVVLEMVAISGGKFLMGSPENEEGRTSWESPQHNVTIQPFFMGKFPVTQSQWQAVAALDKVNIDLNPDPSNFKGANRPVECVSWDDAVEFCARLSKKTQTIYRLPSEAEWEYACRAQTTTPFYFGETITTDLANYRGTDWNLSGTVYPGNYGQGPKGEFREQTTDVGKFPANRFGLFDMHGNVWEWCQDEWHENYNNAPTDGSAWLVENDNQKRLLRGGSWFLTPRYCRSADRFRCARFNGDDYVGFRVVMVRRRT